MEILLLLKRVLKTSLTETKEELLGRAERKIRGLEVECQTGEATGDMTREEEDVVMTQETGDAMMAIGAEEILALKAMIEGNTGRMTGQGT